MEDYYMHIEISQGNIYGVFLCNSGVIYFLGPTQTFGQKPPGISLVH